MAWQKIPTPPEETYHWKAHVELDEEQFLLTWKYFPRLDRWTLSLETAAGVQIFTERHALAGHDFLSRSRHIPECPTGRLFGLNADVNDYSPATYLTAGRSFTLYYDAASG